MSDRPDLESLCRYWQKVLRLQDWFVTSEYRRAPDMHNPWTQASIHITPDLNKATMSICDPIDRIGPHFDPVEQNVIHELLHIRREETTVPQTDTTEYKLWERDIEITAWAFYRLNRGERPE